MPVRDVLLYPDAFLRQKCRPVTAEELGSPQLERLAQDLTDTLYAQPGAVGLAAPQIGEPVQLLVMDESAATTRDRLRVLVNPVLAQLSQWKYSREGCLSFPDYLVTVKRARRAAAEWLTPDGEPRADELRDFAAIILQHEVDHLHGILFIDRMRDPQKDLILRGGAAVSVEP